MVDGWYEFRGHGKGDDAESVFGFGRQRQGCVEFRE